MRLILLSLTTKGVKPMRCQVCGKTLTNPTSLSRGIGPVCWNKIQKGKSLARNLFQPGDLDKEKDLLIYLNKRKNVKVASASIKSIRRRISHYRRKGFRFVDKFPYGNYGFLRDYIQKSSEQEFVVICTDRILYEQRATEMVVALLESIKPES